MASRKRVKTSLMDSQPLFSEPPDYNYSNSDSGKDHEEENSQPFDDHSQDFTYCDDNTDIEEENRYGNTEELTSKHYDKKNCFTQTEEDIESQTKVIKDRSKKSDGDNENQNTVTCVHCTFDKELDKRNYFFGNLLIGELQFLPPCMRSEAYRGILKYVDTLKNKHMDQHNNSNV